MTCSPGYASLPGSSNCTLCPAGYSAVGGSANCSICPSGKNSSAGSSGCTTCPLGFNSTAGSSSCDFCASGYYRIEGNLCKPPGYVSTIAGSPGVVGWTDGQGLSASFNAPFGVAVDSFGNLFIADTGNNKIRKINSTGYVSTIAGSGAQGSADGQGLSASFKNPHGIAVDSFGNLYIADTNNFRIRIINSTGYVSTIAGSGVWGSADGQGQSALLRNPLGIAMESVGNLYITDLIDQRIRKINSTGYVSTIAGSGVIGSANGQGLSASFRYPNGIAVDSVGNLYIVDWGNNRIRKINSTGYVSTIAGSGDIGSADGQGLSASFQFPFGIAVDSFGNLYIVDSYNHRIRKINSTGYVSTVAGFLRGFNDGQGPIASFNLPTKVAFDPTGYLYVTESPEGNEFDQSHRVRRVVIGIEP
jgi:sugar lactone lactonase YvrE